MEAALAEAEEAADQATRERDHALERYDSAVDAMWAAYHALRECRERNGGSMPPPPDLGDVPLGGDTGGESGGGSTPGGSEPEPPSEPDQTGCEPGTSEWRTESTHDFTSPGDTVINPSRGGADWAAYISGQGGGIGPEVFLGLDDEIDDLSADVDTGEGVLADNVTVTATIEVVDIEVACERLYECNPQTGEMEPTDTVRARQSQTVRTERLTGRAGDSTQMAEFVRSVQAKVRAHKESADAFSEFRCE